MVRPKCACPSGCGFYAQRKGNYANDCEWRKENKLKCDHSTTLVKCTARYGASDLGKKTRKKIVKKARKRYAASDAGKASHARCDARYHASDLGKKTTARWLLSEPGAAYLAASQTMTMLKAKDAERARRAANRAMRALMTSAERAADLAGRTAKKKAWSDSYVAAMKVVDEICERGGAARVFNTKPTPFPKGKKNALTAMALKTSLCHASNCAPQDLNLTDDGEPYFLRPGDYKNRGKSYLEGVWASAGGRADFSLGFVDNHRGRGFLRNARDYPANNSLFLYVIESEHAQYKDFKQMLINGGSVPFGLPGYFVKCKNPVDVGPDTTGASCYRIYWPDGPDRPACAEDAYHVDADQELAGLDDDAMDLV